MKLVIDMNLSPDWVDWFKLRGIEAVHWSSIGDIRALDSVIFDWAHENGCVVFTHDLDFGTLLAKSGASSPSVLQVRIQNVSISGLGGHLESLLGQKEAVHWLEKGALVTVDGDRLRLRVLPLKRN